MRCVRNNCDNYDEECSYDDDDNNNDSDSACDVDYDLCYISFNYVLFIYSKRKSLKILISRTSLVIPH